MNPARMFLESLDRRPGIREQPGSLATFRQEVDHFRSFPNSRHFQIWSACLKGARSRHRFDYSITWSAATCRVSGTVRPSTFAVLRLAIGSMTKPRSTSRRAAGPDPDAAHLPAGLACPYLRGNTTSSAAIDGLWVPH
jgi:hypothetical protein